jgi:hypothetical protein
MVFIELIVSLTGFMIILKSLKKIKPARVGAQVLLYFYSAY